MTQEHPITPPPHLLKQWMKAAQDAQKQGGAFAKTFALAAINWALAQLKPSDSTITPPPELVRQWMERTEYDEHTWFYESYIAEQAARWGSDQELEACCEWVEREIGHGREWGAELRATRRPKPPSLKEAALAELDLLKGDANAHGLGFDASAIRRALKSLPD